MPARFERSLEGECRGFVVSMSYAPYALPTTLSYLVPPLARGSTRNGGQPHKPNTACIRSSI